jgi:hypothetical protein
MKARQRLGGLLLALLLMAVGRVPAAAELPPSWESLPKETALLADPGARVVHISARFLGTPYQANTLGGGSELPEVLTARFDAVDCFTFLDYVEALRRSADAGEFRTRLIEVRYRDGVVGWGQRRHFFTDWAAAPGGRVVDVTAEVGGALVRQAVKQLNRGADGILLLPGVAVQERLIHFVPADALDSQVLGRLRPGDYVGVYTPKPGLDVTHVGLVVRRGNRLSLRHASSRREAGQVIDSDFLTYLADKPGIVVLRPVEP